MAHMARMKGLVATATAAATSASCARSDDVKTVTITPLAAPSTTVAQVPLNPTASATFTAPDPPPPPPPDPSGYLVVDMLPAPARCLGVANAAHITAKFRRIAGVLGVEVDIVLGAGTTFVATPPTLAFATLLSSSFRSNQTVAVARAQPSLHMPGPGAVTFNFDVDCGGAQGMLVVNLTYAGPPVDGTVPKIALHDY